MSKENVTIVNAPTISLTESEKAAEALLKFYRKLGWNEDDLLDPTKVRTTKDVYKRLYDVMLEKCADSVGVAMLLVNRGPGVDDYIKPEKVHLLEGWIIPAKTNTTGGMTDENQQ